MLHVDDPADGDPPLDAEGETVLEPFRYAVSDAGSRGQAGDELPESGGVLPTIVVAVGAAMLLAGSALPRGSARRD